MLSYTLRFCILARTLGAKYDILEDAFWEFRKKHIKWNQDAKTAVKECEFGRDEVRRGMMFFYSNIGWFILSPIEIKWDSGI